MKWWRGVAGRLALVAVVGCGGGKRPADAGAESAGGAGAPMMMDAAGSGGANGDGRDLASEDQLAEDAPPADAPPTDASPADASPADGPAAELVNRKFPGGSCTSPDQCLSGFCEQGVCCQTSCAGICRSCATSGTGVCMPIPAEQDPLLQCPVQGSVPCGNMGGCDGFGACRFRPTGTPCGGAMCSEATFMSTRTCDGAGTCQPATSTTCKSAAACFSTGCVDLRVACSRPTAETSGSMITVYLEIESFGGATVALSDLEARYWYTEDSPGDQVVDCDYAVLDRTALLLSVVPVSPPRTGANFYAAVGFSASLGTLPGFGDTGQIQLRIHAPDYTITYDQTNDYSYPAPTTAAECPKLTLYYKGILVWGTEP
jgi:hypothetical protein